VATLVTWPEIVPTDSVVKIGATAIAPLLELLATLLVNSNPQTPSSTTSCKNWVLVVPLLEAQLLLASKPVDMVMTVEQPSPGNVDPLEDLLRGLLVAVVVVANRAPAVASRALVDQPHGPLVVVPVEAAQVTAMEEVATVVGILRAAAAAQHHGSNNKATHLLNNKLDTAVATVDMDMAERQATTKATDRQQPPHPAWHHGNSKATAMFPLLLLRTTTALTHHRHHLQSTNPHLPHQALEQDWRRGKTGVATECR
jgi:hypothetical protein